MSKLPYQIPVTAAELAELIVDSKEDRVYDITPVLLACSQAELNVWSRVLAGKPALYNVHQPTLVVASRFIANGWTLDMLCNRLILSADTIDVLAQTIEIVENTLTPLEK